MIRGFFVQRLQRTVGAVFAAAPREKKYGLVAVGAEESTHAGSA